MSPKSGEPGIVVVRGRHDYGIMVREMILDGFEDGRVRASAKQCERSIEAGKNKEVDSTFQPPEGNTGLPTPSAGSCVGFLTYRTLR